MVTNSQVSCSLCPSRGFTDPKVRGQGAWWGRRCRASDSESTLHQADYWVFLAVGFLNVLRVLTTVGDISVDDFNARYDFMANRNDTYYVLVICDDEGVVVGTGCVVVERKFIHGLGMEFVAHCCSAEIFFPWGRGLISVPRSRGLSMT